MYYRVTHLNIQAWRGVM